MRIGFMSWWLFIGKGGIERLVTNLTAFLQKRGHECIIFHNGSGNGSPCYPLASGVRTFDLNLTDISSRRKAKAIMEEMKLDVFCVMNGCGEAINFLMLCHDSNIPLIMSEHTSPYAFEQCFWNRPERLACLAAADIIHLLFSTYRSSLPDFLQERVTIIPNPAPSLHPINWDKQALPRKKILFVGRLNESIKQPSLLIKAFSLLAADFPDWDCCMCGDGIGRPLCEDMIRKLHIEDRVSLAGVVDNVGEYYDTSHIFCTPSAFEGFPLVLLEAQSYGLPAVGFAGCTGVNEIILHGQNGLLAREMTSESLAGCLQLLMTKTTLRQKMGEKAQKLLLSYDETKVFSQWEDLLQRAAQAKNNTRLDTLEIMDDSVVKEKLQQILAREHPLQERDAELREQQKKQRIRELRTFVRAAQSSCK